MYVLFFSATTGNIFIQLGVYIELTGSCVRTWPEFSISESKRKKTEETEFQQGTVFGLLLALSYIFWSTFVPY